MRKIVLTIILVMGLAALVAGCAPQASVAPAAATVAPAPPTSPPPASPPTTAPPTSTPAAAPPTAQPATKAASGNATSVPASTAKLSGDINVFAAASLTEAFKEIGANFEKANPGTKVTLNFAGSQQLVQQISQGAPADVFASAARKQMDDAITASSVISGTERSFVRNRLVTIYPSDNKAGVKTLQDLAKPGRKVVLAAKEVPVGQYALDFLDKASKDPAFGAGYKDAVLKNVVSYEQDVRAVLSKIMLGEGDAGIVYTTDVTPDAAAKVGRIEIPDALNTIASYYIAPVKASKNPDLSAAFMKYVLSPDGQTVLAKYGFIPTTGTATGAAPGAVPLNITGLVDKPITLSADDLRKKPQTSIKATDRGSTEQTYTGVLISTLLKEAGVKPMPRRSRSSEAMATLKNCRWPT
ncbi:MAG: molybdate ABC transporter substrate-binding protein [Anaerolineae bacterium]